MAVLAAGMTARAVDFGVAPADFGLAPGETLMLPPPQASEEQMLYQAALAPIAPAQTQTMQQPLPQAVAQNLRQGEVQVFYAPGQIPGQAYAPQMPQQPVYAPPPAVIPAQTMAYRETVVPLGAAIPAGMGEPTANFLPGAPPPVIPAPVPAPVPAPAVLPGTGIPAYPAPAYALSAQATPPGAFAATPAQLSGIYPTTEYELQAIAPDLYASLAATVTATAGDPSVPVVVRPATTAQAMDAAGVPVSLAGLAAAGTPVVDWNAARAGAPYPVDTPGQPGVLTYVVPIQVPVLVDAAGQGVPAGQLSPLPPLPAQAGQTGPITAVVAPVGASIAALPATAGVQSVIPPQATPYVTPSVSFIQPGTPGQIVPPVNPANPFANIIAVTPGAHPVVPTATAGAGLAGQGGVFYYGTNPVSIASAIGMETADGRAYVDFGAISRGAINLVTPAQIKQAIAQRAPLVIIDVRGDLVREIEGHVPGDVNVPFQPPETFAARVARVAPDRNIPVVVYCQDGVWSSQAADVLLAMGYKTFLMGSYRLWLA